MGVLPDWMIERDVKIEPFQPAQHRKGVVSFGVSSYGYDARVGFRFKIFTTTYCGEVDPKRVYTHNFVDMDVTPHPRHAWHPTPLITTGERRMHKCSNCEQTYVPGLEKDYPEPLYCWKNGIASVIRIPPNSFALAETMESFEIPRDILAVCLGKSTYARCGIIVNVTPLEPEWRGRVTVEISNTTPLPAVIYPGEGIMQILFLKAEEVCRTSYADKKGKYQDQDGLTLPKVL